MDKLELNLTNVGPEIVIRSGAALPVYDPRQVAIEGTIEAPGDFAEMRKSKIDPLAAHVIANYTAHTIVLYVDEQDKFMTTVTGTLALNPELAKLQINQQKTWDEKGLLNLLKFAGAYFQSRTDHEAIIERLKRFTAVVHTEFENADDYKGAKAQSKITKITHDVPLEFVAAMPIFGGGDVETFKVDICVGLVSGGVDFWLESTDLHERIIQQTSAIFDGEIERLKDYVIVKKF